MALPTRYIHLNVKLNMSILQFVGPILISKEFKESQRVNDERETKETMHLISWLNHLVRRDKPRYTVHFNTHILIMFLFV